MKENFKMKKDKDRSEDNNKNLTPDTLLKSIRDSIKNSKNSTNRFRNRFSVKDKHKGNILDKRVGNKKYKF